MGIHLCAKMIVFLLCPVETFSASFPFLPPWMPSLVYAFQRGDPNIKCLCCSFSQGKSYETLLLASDLMVCLFSRRNCGIEDPSWAELRHFVNFLNSQLQACEESSFCNMELVGDTLEGFRSFVVRFMILMSRVSFLINKISNNHSISLSGEYYGRH